jgi:hypothetical protein
MGGLLGYGKAPEGRGLGWCGSQMQQLAMSDSGGLEIGRKLFQDFGGFLLTPLQ